MNQSGRRVSSAPGRGHISRWWSCGGAGADRGGGGSESERAGLGPPRSLGRWGWAGDDRDGWSRSVSLWPQASCVPLWLKCMNVENCQWELLSYKKIPFPRPLLCPCCAAWDILVPWPRTEPVPSAVKAQSPNCWTARELSYRRRYHPSLSTPPLHH